MKTTIKAITTYAFFSIFLAAELSIASPSKTSSTLANYSDRHRLIVLTDIEADPDDTQSLIRLMLYSNQIDIEGLIATTSVHQRTQVAPESIYTVLDAYEKIQPNLLKHEQGFPAASTLRNTVTTGLPVYGMKGVGKNKDSQGSGLIVDALKKNDSRPLWITVWGGSNTLAQALYSLRENLSPAEVNKLVSKLRVYAISDQDDSGIWIRTNFPELFYIVSPGGYGAATWSGIKHVQPEFDNSEISNRWIAEHLQQGHGPLGALYPDVAYGIEGDTPSYLSLIVNGLNNPERPDWGGWGGRYEYYIPHLENMDPKGFNGGVPIEPEPRPIWTNAIDTWTPYIAGEYGKASIPHEHSATGFVTTLWRWRKDFQNDFAARMDWTTRDYQSANHPPVVKLGHAEMLEVKAGEDFFLSAAGTTDPDGDSLSYLWFHYPEAGSYKKNIKISHADNLYRVQVKAPQVDSPQTAHFILQVTDKGLPPLTRYRRVIVTINP